MLFAPFNFVFSLERVAVFEWEPIQLTQPDSKPPAPTTGPDCAPEADQDSEHPGRSGMQLVFKGYEWGPVAAVPGFPPPSWEDLYTASSTGTELEDDPGTSKERRQRDRQDEAARRLKSAGVAQDATNLPDDSFIGPRIADLIKPRQP